eukprot:364475-Chlamydomonas_euryale.AAC.3
MLPVFQHESPRGHKVFRIAAAAAVTATVQLVFHMPRAAATRHLPSHVPHTTCTVPASTYAERSAHSASGEGMNTASVNMGKLTCTRCLATAHARNHATKRNMDISSTMCSAMLAYVHGCLHALQN